MAWITTVINDFSLRFDGLYGRLYQGVFVYFSLLLAFICAGSVLWDPQILAEKIGGFNVINGPGLIWATCTCVIHGMSFKPHFWLWQCVFFPPLAWVMIFVFIFV